MPNRKSPEISKVPSREDFAHNLAYSYMEAEGIQIEAEDDDGPMDVIASVPELQNEFTIWLCNLIYNSTYEEDVKNDTLLN